MFKTVLEKDITKAVAQLGVNLTGVQMSIPQDSNHGDYTTNVALQLSKQVDQNIYQSPRDIANRIIDSLKNLTYVSRVEVAGPGFINIFIKEDYLLKVLTFEYEPLSEGKKILIEYASPNAAKPFHIGHLRNISIGESLSRLLEFTGHPIFRANYTSDIGLPIAKVVWSVQQHLDEYNEIQNKSLKEKAAFLGRVYVAGNKAYEEGETSKQEIDTINKSLYNRDPQIYPIWENIRKWSEGYLEIMYSRLGSEFDSVLWESEVEEEGKLIVQEHIGDVFERDDGAIIFPGEKYGLHNRVFITSAGNPTYEAKELGVTRKESELFPFDYALHVVGNEQIDYFKVVIKAIEVIDSEMQGKKIHLPYGFVNLSTGKMSSREGTVITAEDLIDRVKDALRPLIKDNNLPSQSEIIEKIALAAIKFSFLRYSLASDITFDINQSISLQGDSGPYLQYTYARIHSLLNQPDADITQNEEFKSINLELEERLLLRQLEYFDYFVNYAAETYAPNEICGYLINLAKYFNLFYQKHPILKSEKAQFRLLLSSKVGQTIQMGLDLLGIETVERM